MQGGGGSAVGEQLELLADAVLGLSASAIEIVIEGGGIQGGRGVERGDDEAGSGAFQRVLGFADDTALAAPAVEGSIAEVVEHPRRLARSQAEPLGLGQRLGEHRLEADIASQAEHIVDAVRLAPRHQRVIGKPLSARSVMRTRGQDRRIWPTMRAISSAAPALPATLAHRWRANSRLPP